MSSTHDNQPSGEPTMADALRQVADWLDAHAELTAGFAHVWLDAGDRNRLEAVAAALGDRAQENVRSGDVEVVGYFGRDDNAVRGGVGVSASVPFRRLGIEPTPPAYEPIIPVKAAA